PVRPFPAKSPVTISTPGVLAQPGKSPAGSLVTVQVPSPLSKATGIVSHPDTPVRATPVRPFPAKSPVTTLTPGVVAQAGKLPAGSLVTVQVPSPLAKATGIVAQPAAPVSATSVRPFPAKSPVTTLTPGVLAQAG